MHKYAEWNINVDVKIESCNCSSHANDCVVNKTWVSCKATLSLLILMFTDE